MTLSEFGVRIGRHLVVEQHRDDTGKSYYRCYYPDTEVKRAIGNRYAVIVATSDYKEIALEDLAWRLRNSGGIVRVRDIRGSWSSHPIPVILTA
jgi:hypothetical protein